MIIGVKRVRKIRDSDCLTGSLTLKESEDIMENMVDLSHMKGGESTQDRIKLSLESLSLYPL
mgnify:CR=1 FL=1|jgi:hypothetical protein